MLFYLGRFYALKYYSKFGNKNKEIINWHSMLDMANNSCYITSRTRKIHRVYPYAGKQKQIF